MKIQIKLLVTVFLIILLSAGITILVSQTIARNIVEGEICNQLANSAQSRANHIGTILNGYIQVAELMAVGNAFRDSVDESKNYTKSIEQVNRKINSTVGPNGEISRIRLLDKNGIVIASSHADVGQNKSADDIFLKGKESVYLGDVHTSEFTGGKVISTAAPILVDGESSGVLVLNFDVDTELYEITTDRTGLGERGELYIVNKDEYMITPSKFLSQNDTFLKQKVETYHFGDEEEEAKYLGVAGYEHDVILCENYLGTDVVRAHTHVPDLGWYVIAEISEEEVFAPIAELTRMLLWALICLSLLGLTLSILISRTITQPIVKLQHGVEEIGKGNLDYKTGTKASDEIGQLSRAFDGMSTELKNSRVELEEYSRGLEAKVEERTKELDEKAKEAEEQTIASLNLLQDVTETKIELETAKSELKAKNTELERFTYTVSHDLRSPLITVQGFVELLRKDLERNEREKVENDLKYIETGTAKMEHLLNDTLRLSRIGRMVNPPEDVPFGEIVQETLEQTAQQIKSSGVEITVAEVFPTVQVDRMRIVEVLVNLVTNSINYMGEQPRPKIDIGYRVDGEETVFFVRDNGIGIDKSQHEKVFELFYTVDKSGKGTGAGLAIVKRIIEVHNGRIWIESEKDKGCTVCFTLPVA